MTAADRNDLLDALGSIAGMDGGTAASRLVDLLPHLQGAAHRLRELAMREHFDVGLARSVVADGFRVVALAEEVAGLAAGLQAELDRLPLFAGVGEAIAATPSTM